MHKNRQEHLGIFVYTIGSLVQLLPISVLLSFDYKMQSIFTQ